MPQVVAYLDDFSAGVLSLGMRARVASDMYKRGLVDAMNFVPTATGSAINTPGSFRIAQTLDGNRKQVTVYSIKSDKYWTAVFTDLKVRFYPGWGTLANRQTYQECTTTILEAEVKDIQVRQVKGKIFIVHENHKPQMIEINASDVFQATVEPTMTGGVETTGEITLFNASNNYPSVICIAAGRMIIGATKADPSKLWISRDINVDGTERYTDFRRGATMTAQDGFTIQETDMLGARIMWVESFGSVVVGTSRGIHRATTPYISAVDTDNLQAFDIVPALNTGAGFVPPVKLGQLLVYVGSTRRTIHAIQFDSSSNLQEVEISRVNREVLKPNIVEIASMESPYPSVWCLLQDGNMVVCSVDLSSGNVAMCPQEAGIGKVWQAVSVARLGVEDDIYTGCTDAYGHYLDLRAPFDPDNYQLGDDQPHYMEDGFFVNLVDGPHPDGQLEYESADLELGEEYEVWADYGPRPAVTAVAGTTHPKIVFDRLTQAAHIGARRTYYMQPTIPDIPVQGSGQAQTRAIQDVVLRLIRSYGGAVGPDLDNLQELEYLTPGDYVFGDPIGQFTGDIRSKMHGWNTQDQTLVIAQRIPAPIEVAGIVVRIEVTEVV